MAETEYGVRVVITPDKTVKPDCSCGGVAQLNSFTSSADSPVWAFLMPTSTYGSEKRTAEVSSHEIGHSVGLYHDGRSSATYYDGHGIWAPIMGKSYNRILSQFSKGEYTGATDTKDDLAVMSGFMPYRSDDTGNTAGTAKALGSNADRLKKLIQGYVITLQKGIDTSKLSAT